MGAYDKFIADILPYAKEVEKKYGVPTSVTIGQAIHESAGGTRTPKDLYSGQESYNLFGVKGEGNAGSVSSWTWESIKGQTVKVIAKFRAYADWGGSLDNYGKLLSGDRYKNALTNSNPYEVLAGIKNAGYATDPSYTSKVSSIMKSYNLTQYDGEKYKGDDSVSLPEGNQKPPMSGIGNNPKPPELGGIGGGSGGGLPVGTTDDLKGTLLFTIPIPMTDGIAVWSGTLFSVSLFVIAAILIILTLYSLFLTNSPIGSIVSSVKKGAK